MGLRCEWIARISYRKQYVALYLRPVANSGEKTIFFSEPVYKVSSCLSKKFEAKKWTWPRKSLECAHSLWKDGDTN